MEQQTWMTLVGLAGFALALFSYLGVIRRDLGGRIDRVEDRLEQVRAEARADNRATRDDLREELGGRIDDLGRRIDDQGRRIDDLRADVADIRAGQRTLEQRFFEVLSPRYAAATGTEDA